MQTSDTARSSRRSFGGERRGLNPQPSEPQSEGKTARRTKIETHSDASGGPAACWPWTGSVDKDGYAICGRLDRLVSRTLLARKLGRALLRGEVARHTCDNPPCVNPAHLIEGSRLDNVRDREERNRTARGEQVPHAKLTAADVLAILREAGPAPDRAACKAIGARYGVDRAVVLDIARGRRWNSVTGLPRARRVLPHALRGTVRKSSPSPAELDSSSKANRGDAAKRLEPGNSAGRCKAPPTPSRAGRGTPALFSSALADVVDMFGDAFDAAVRR